MKNLFKLFVVVLAAFLLEGVAHAIPITGNVSMVGFGISNFNPLTATSIPDPSHSWVTAATGDFATYLNYGESVDYNGFTFDPATSPVVDPLWTAGGFSFSLESVKILNRTEHMLELVGSGILYGNGFDATIGSWGMKLFDIGRLTFNFSNTTSATPTPEPSTIILLGVSILAISGLYRRKLKIR